MTTPIYQITAIARGGSVPDLLSVCVEGETEENFQNTFYLMIDSIGLPRTVTETKKITEKPGYEGVAYLSSSNYRNINNKAALAAQVILNQGKEVRLYLYGNSPERDIFAFKPIVPRLV